VCGNSKEVDAKVGSKDVSSHIGVAEYQEVTVQCLRNPHFYRRLFHRAHTLNDHLQSGFRHPGLGQVNKHDPLWQRKGRAKEVQPNWNNHYLVECL
jgi:hypothetical protein